MTDFNDRLRQLDAHVQQELQSSLPSPPPAPLTFEQNINKSRDLILEFARLMMANPSRHEYNNLLPATVQGQPAWQLKSDGTQAVRLDVYFVFHADGQPELVYFRQEADMYAHEPYMQRVVRLRDGGADTARLTLELSVVVKRLEEMIQSMHDLASSVKSLGDIPALEAANATSAAGHMPGVEAKRKERREEYERRKRLGIPLT